VHFQGRSSDGWESRQANIASQPDGVEIKIQNILQEQSNIPIHAPI